ncbi:MAG: DUF3737 family protein [Clostridia bacterium]|nr:DUF3737 family protein [Clostridia bacterium]
MREFNGTEFTEERALFGSECLAVNGCAFDIGESPLKECRNISVNGSIFKGKYPLWYCSGIDVSGSTFYEGARAGIWYTSNISIIGSEIIAPKCFRRAEYISLTGVKFTNAAETFWNCRKIKLDYVYAKGDYFAMNSSDIEAAGLTVEGNYAFDSVKNLVIRNSKLVTKDAFWNSENVTVYDSYISGEYLAWNSKNVTFINCTIDSLQGLCYIENLKLVNCKLQSTNLAFEYSSVEADVSGTIKSVFNPLSGRIKADCISELIIDSGRIDPEMTEIVCEKVEKHSDRPDWKEELA